MLYFALCGILRLHFRAFEELVLGLSWRGNPEDEGVGGICQGRVRIKSDKNAYSFNALFISLKSSQVR